MSIRLNVVLSQSAQGPQPHRDLESDVVARLIGAPGIDLYLIESLDALGENSTDRLVLERLGGDLAMLCWETPAEAAARLAAAGIEGRRAPHALDPEAPETKSDRIGASGERRIYYHSLSGHSLSGQSLSGQSAAAAVQQAVEQLLAARRIVTFQLAPAPPTGAGSNRSASTPSTPTDKALRGAPPQVVAVSKQPLSKQPLSKRPVSERPVSERPATRDESVIPPRRSTPSAGSPAESDRWDALVDELNDSNI